MRANSFTSPAPDTHPRPLKYLPKKISICAPALRAAATCLLAWSALTLTPAHAAKKNAPSSPAAPEIAERQADLGELRGRIEGLRKDLNTSEENKADAADRLRESERQISRLQRELHELTDQRGRLQKDSKILSSNQRTWPSHSTSNKAQLEKLLYKQYLRGTPDSPPAIAQRR